ncbi:endochitinase-like [Dermacentor andersoni]|uniref:endochitinase-like n=1 Tax=Dermacentor andersoni TaxID=34620 RepID=UPI0021558F1B|nr:endochitinase-like [Dermacentor andersoni]
MPEKEASDPKGGAGVEEDPFLKSTCVYSISSCMILILVFFMALPGALMPYLTRVRFIRDVPKKEDIQLDNRGPEPLLICQLDPHSFSRPPPWTYAQRYIPVHLCSHIVLPLVGLPDFFSDMQNYDSLTSANPPFHLADLTPLVKSKPHLRLLAGLGSFQDASGLLHRVALSQERSTAFARNLLRWTLVNRLDGLMVTGLFPVSDGHLRNSAVRLLKKLATLFRHREFLLVLPPESSLLRRPNAGKRLAQLVDMVVLPPQWIGRSRALENVLASSFPPSKLIGAIRFEGIPYTLNHRDSYTGSVPGNEHTFAYHELCAKRGWKRHSDGDITLLHRGRSWFIYEDAQSLAMQTAKFMEKGLAGILVWDVSADDFLGFCGTKNILLETVHNASLAMSASLLNLTSETWNNNPMNASSVAELNMSVL